MLRTVLLSFRAFWLPAFSCRDFSLTLGGWIIPHHLCQRELPRSVMSFSGCVRNINCSYLTRRGWSVFESLTSCVKGASSISSLSVIASLPGALRRLVCHGSRRGLGPHAGWLSGQGLSISWEVCPPL